MKKILFLLMAMIVFGFQSVNAQDKPIKVITNHPDFDVKVKRCAMNGKSLIIDMVFTNKGDQDVLIDIVAGNWRYWSGLYDDEGNAYKGENGGMQVKVANNGAYQGDVGNYRLIQGIPVKVSFLVNNFSETAEEVAFFEGAVFCKEWGLPGQDKWLTIRNIPITRE